MIVDLCVFLAGILGFTLGPFLAIYAYYQGVPGPTCFAAGMVVWAIGFGLLAGSL